MTPALGWIDLLVLAASLGLAIMIGLGLRGRSQTLESYVLGDRDLPWWAILGSIVATETSTATVLSVPGLGFGATGMTFLQLALGYVIGRVIVSRVLLPRYFEGRLFTAYEVLGRRFGPAATRAASVLFLVTRNLGDGLRLFLTALVLQQLAGWSFAASVVVMGAVTLLYTWFGGMRSVVWNDCIQLVIYMTGAIVAVFVIAGHVPGGWAEIRDFGLAHGRFRIVDPVLSWTQPYTLWAGLVGGAVLTMGTHGTDQMMVQRYLSARGPRDAARALVASGLVVFAQFAIFLFIGVELGAFYAHHPEITFARTDLVFSHFIVHEFPINTGLVGLMLAAVLAAAMSTLSSSLNSSASTLISDFHLPRQTTPVPPARALRLTQLATILFGIVQMTIGYGAVYLTGTVVDSALTIAGFSAGLMLGVYALAIGTGGASGRDALFGAICGLAALVGLYFVAPLAGGSRLAYPWLAVAGAGITWVAGAASMRISRRHLAI